MATVLKIGKRRCDAICHNATKGHCTCICAGRYHGAKIKHIDLPKEKEASTPLVIEPPLYQLWTATE